jgi:hypothetical protein
MDNFQELKKRVKDYSAFKKVKKMQELDREQYFKERDKEQEAENFERFKDDMYGVELKKGGMTKGQKKVGKVMREFKKGELHSGKKGPVVKSRKQAIAIALSEAGMSKPKQMSTGGDVVVGKGQDYIKDLI